MHVQRLLLIATAITIATSVPVYSSDEPSLEITTDQIFSVAHGDWNNDEAADAVIIIDKDGHQFDVLFYLTDKSQRLKLHDHVPDMVWGSSVMYGQEPWVSVLKNGSITLGSQNFSIGRNRWQQELIIAFRNSEFVVAGLNYSHYDTLDPEANGSCDLNLLTGKGVVDDENVTFPATRYNIHEISQNMDGFYNLCLKNHR